MGTITRDEIDDTAEQAAMYAAQYALMATDYALFEPEEVIFDTAASKSIFKNPNILIAVAPSDSPIEMPNKVPRECASITMEISATSAKSASEKGLRVTSSPRAKCWTPTGLSSTTTRMTSS